MIEPSPEALNVSRETFERLQTYVSLLQKWSPKINLVSRSTLDNVWDRHVQDSLQVLRAAKGCRGHWADLGAGGGLPGLIILLCQPETLSTMTLIESDARKSAFLRTVLRATGVSATILCERIEAAPPQHADILTARALAPLAKLLAFAQHHMKPDGTALFPKGVTWENEVAAARKTFSFTCDPIKSETQDGAVILRIGAISRV